MTYPDLGTDVSEGSFISSNMTNTTLNVMSTFVFYPVYILNKTI